MDGSQIELILLKYVQHKDDRVLVITGLGQEFDRGRYERIQNVLRMNKRKEMGEEGEEKEDWI